MWCEAPESINHSPFLLDNFSIPPALCVFSRLINVVNCSPLNPGIPPRSGFSIAAACCLSIPLPCAAFARAF
ncbi:hypothetical protein Fmac_020080 [Flemingia macrophylla]|uniref:Uncharacterized protein n=1 Tax=Flemingia macrophylla TaxID=520843 RepID=A0ABD1M9M3_9FABA